MVLVLVDPNEFCNGMVDEAFLFDDMELLRPAAQFILDLIRDMRRIGQPLVRWFRCLINLLYTRTGPDLLDKLRRSIEVIQEGAEVRIDLLQRLVFRIGVKAIVADVSSDRDIVLLLDKTVIVLSVRAPAGEGNTGVVAVIEERSVDELTTVITIQSQPGKRQVRTDLHNAFLHPTVSAVS